MDGRKRILLQALECFFLSRGKSSLFGYRTRQSGTMAAAAVGLPVYDFGTRNRLTIFESGIWDDAKCDKGNLWCIDGRTKA